MPEMTGAERYFHERRQNDPEYAEAFALARRQTVGTDRIVRALDARREQLGLTKAELARRADMPPEVVRRLFGAVAPNPTIRTLLALAGVLDVTIEVAVPADAAAPATSRTASP